ncbi:MAG TPA: ADOP family duplicated permease [Gemmatimonadales bacterium]|jgi:predicted permease|nr:ADOP family duplicated permease [Gemmatimonadales bacterium]
MRALQDLRYAARGLLRSPGFSATVILTLGLGLGANAAMFGVIDRLMFRPFSYLNDPGTVHRVYLRTTYRGRTSTNFVFPYTRYLDLARGSSSFAAWAGATERPLAVGTGTAARERRVAGVSASFFGFFAIRPALGRFFGASEDSLPQGAKVAVLGYGFWQSELGGRNVLGEQLAIGTVSHTIVGVAPRDFVGISEAEPPAVFIPLTAFPLAAGENKTGDYWLKYNWDWISAIARRKPGVSEATASADLSQAYRASRSAARLINPAVLPDSIAHPVAFAGAVKTAAGPSAGLESRTLVWVTGVAAIVLLIACANVTSLMFARVIRRRRELSVRLALGVGRRRLAGQLFTESLLLAALGCLAGLAIAWWGGLVLRRLVLTPALSQSGATDWRTLLAAASFALLAGVLTAIGPALLAVRGDLAASLKSGPREGTRQRSGARSALLVLQGALSVLLLVGAHLFVQSLRRVRALDLGYDPAPVLMVRSDLRGQSLDRAELVRFRHRLLAAAREIPGVVAAARINSRPFGTNTTRLVVPGVDSVERLGRFNYQVADPDYFAVMGTRILRGRGFTEADREGSPSVAVVSRSMARALWPDPLGRCIQAFLGPDPLAPCTTVIGIAEDAAQQNLTDDPRFMYYLPLDQVDPSWGSQLFLRMAGPDAAGSAERVRLALNRTMPGQGYVSVQPMEDLLDRQRRSWQLGATLFVGFGVLALLVAAVGLYGTVSYDVAQRTHELGVRSALGARSVHLVGLVVGQAVRLAGAGVVLGLALALLAAPWIQPLLFKQSARDPATYGLVAMLLLGVAVLASAMPSRRAARADPNLALRSD